MAFPNASRLVRLGIRLAWGLGENMYRGDSEYYAGLLRSLYILEKQNLYGETNFHLNPPLNHFPANYPINTWLANEKQFPAPGAQIRTIQDDAVVVIDPGQPAPVPFPETNDPENPPDPLVYSTTNVEGRWLYDVAEWKVIGKVCSSEEPIRGRWLYVAVDNKWVGWNGTSWVVGASGTNQRSIEIGAHYPKPFIGGTMFIYVAAQPFRLPKNLPGSMGFASVKGAVSMGIFLGESRIGGIHFPIPGPLGLRPTFSLASDVEFAAGSRLSVIAEDGTYGISNVSVSLRGILD